MPYKALKWHVWIFDLTKAKVRFKVCSKKWLHTPKYLFLALNRLKCIWFGCCFFRAKQLVICVGLVCVCVMCLHARAWMVCMDPSVCVCAWLPEGVYVMLSVVVACLSDCLVASVCLSKHTCLFQYALCARRVCVCVCV